MTAPRRARASDVTVWELGATEEHPWLIECPACAHRAVLIGLRVVCRWCGHDRTSPSRTAALWLRTPCCGDELYAVNERHLEILEGYLLADHRERRHDATTGWSNQAVTSRLPRWMKLATHREEVARGLARLRERLGEGLGG